MDTYRPTKGETVEGLAAFAASYAALHASHMVADHWIQTEWQAANKGRRDAIGRGACVMHVITYVITQFWFMIAMMLATGARIDAPWFFGALAISGVTHYWADRRFTLQRLAERVGHGQFYRLGQPRQVSGLAGCGNSVSVWRVDDDSDSPTGHDNPCLGTGAYALDQSWHFGWLFVAALICSVGA